MIISGYADAEKVQLMVANQAVEDYCFSKILMYVPDLKSDTDRLSDAIDLLRFERSLDFEIIFILSLYLNICSLHLLIIFQSIDYYPLLLISTGTDD